MPPRMLFLGLTLMVIVVACTGEGTTTTTTTQPHRAEEPEPLEVSELPGRLVVLDPSGDVITVNPDGSDPISLTDDAGDSARYTQPSFSPDSDLVVWAETTSRGFGLGLGDSRGGSRTFVPMITPPFYMFWSPDGSAIGALRNRPQGEIDLEMIDVANGSSMVVGMGAPFYFSWSPDSTRVAVHVRYDTFATLERDGSAVDLGATAAGYQAPHWTEKGLFHLGDDGLEVLDPSHSDGRLLATAPGPVALVANTQGTRLAVQSFVMDAPPGISASLSEIPTLPSNAVVVIDVASGETDVVTPNPSIGFFWSPDGEALLVLETNGSRSSEIELLVWRDGKTTRLSAFTPEPSFLREVLPFFDQYSQSLRIWSPDSSAFVLAGAVGAERGLWIYGIGGGSPVRALDGTWAVWSAR